MSNILYNTDIYYEVSDCYGFLGAVLAKKDDTVQIYNSEMYFEAITWLRSMLYNYNSIMASKEHLLPREIYGLKVLERTGLDINDKFLVPIRTAETDKMVKRYKSEFDISYLFDHDLTLTLNEGEAKAFEESCLLKVYVDLDVREVTMVSFVIRLDRDNYCMVKGISPTEFDWMRKSLPPFPKLGDDDHSITKFMFNMIDDAEEQVRENAKGFYSIKADQVIVIR